MPLVERLQCLVEGVELPIAAFARDGMFVGASDAARPLLGFRNLSEAGLDAARDDALKQGRVETPVGIGHMVLQRVGSGADVALVALMEPAAPAAADAVTQAASQPVAPAADLPAPDYEQAASFGEAPAEFALIDDFAERSGTAADTPAAPGFDLQAAAIRSVAGPGDRRGVNGGATRSPKFIATKPHPLPKPPPSIRPRQLKPRPQRRRPLRSSQHLLRHSSPTSHRRHRATCRCASCGRWMRTAASRSARMNSPA